MIVAFKLVRDGVFQEQGITDILQEPGKLPGNYGTRNLRDNLSDLRAQVAANNSGIRLLRELVQEYGLHVVEAYMGFIQHNAEMSVRNMLKVFAARVGKNKVSAVDYMDDGSPIALSIEIDTETGSAVLDFTGTGPQVLGNHKVWPDNCGSPNLKIIGKGGRVGFSLDLFFHIQEQVKQFAASCGTCNRLLQLLCFFLLS